MKKLFNTMLLILFLIVSFRGLSQTAISVANGNWTNPLTWNCTCVPSPGYTITINHNVILNTGFTISTGGITVNTGASLIEDAPGTRDIWLNGGTFSNAGTTDVKYLLAQTGTFSNNGTFTASAFSTYINFTNFGTFKDIDSMYISATVINDGSFLNIDSITNAGTFTNNGTCTYNQFTNNGQFTNNNNLTFTDITNNGTLINADSITALNSGWNQGTFTILTGGYFLVNNDFLNDDISTANDAVLNNNGLMQIKDSWYNKDTVKGLTGRFIVQDTSLNFGFMKETFDFCDLTPPGSAPYIDINSGFVSSGITWCTNSGIKEDDKNKFSVFPNPVSGHLNVEMEITDTFCLTLVDASGKTILNTSEKRIDVSHLPAGFYMLVIRTDNKTVSGKIQIQK